MPDAGTILRLSVRGINVKQEKVTAAEKAFPEINDSTRQTQIFSFRLEIRPETTKSKYLSPTTWMEIMIETIDRSDMAEKIIGYAYFPLFL